MLVAMVSAPGAPAWAMISASFSWYLALRTLCSMPSFCRRLDMCSEVSMVAVPTSTGRPRVMLSLMSAMIAAYFSSAVRYTRSLKSFRASGLFGGMTITLRA
ncbi:hypothetical protein D3C81_1308390 [compost metagenome]